MDRVQGADRGAAGAGHPEGEGALEQLVARVPLFSKLDQEELHEVAGRVRPTSFRRNHQFYGAGENNSKLLIIHSGRVKVYRITESGREQVLRVLGPGDFFGESTFIGGTPSDHFAAAVEDSRICVLHHDDIRDYLLRYPTVAYKMLETLSTRLGRTEQQLSSLAGEDAEHRIAEYLLELAEQAPDAPITLPVPKKDVASYLGLTPETLSRKLAQFEDAGWIRLHQSRRIDVLDPAALRLL
jgi:CRP/FNR family transcriptional regulator